MEIGKKIKELREERGLTRTALAEAIGYGRASIYYWEREEKDPSASAVYALAKYFDVSADYLLGLKDE